VSAENLHEDYLVAIDSKSADFPENNFTKMSLMIPQELLSQLVSTGSDGSVRLGSFLYNNVSGLFPGNLPGRTE
jgi:hypothetical protein